MSADRSSVIFLLNILTLVDVDVLICNRRHRQ